LYGAGQIAVCICACNLRHSVILMRESWHMPNSEGRDACVTAVPCT